MTVKKFWEMVTTTPHNRSYAVHVYHRCYSLNTNETTNRKKNAVVLSREKLLQKRSKCRITILASQPMVSFGYQII